jgi:hypothetical protein
MESEASVNAVRQLLQRMSTNEVAAAESSLKQLVTHPDFFPTTFSILTSPHEECTKLSMQSGSRPSLPPSSAVAFCRP